VSANVDVLIHRYLEGALDAEGAAALEEALRRDPGARRRLAEMAFDHLELRDLVRADPAPAAVRRARPAWVAPLAGAAIILLAVGAALLTARPSPVPAPPPVVPAAASPKEDYRGFAGAVRARVVARGEAGVRMRILEVPGSPGHPLEGRTASVVPGFARGDAGDVAGPNKTHQAFLRRLEEGSEIVLDVRIAGEDLFLIGELTKAQAAWAVPRDGDRPREKRKDGVRRDREEPKEEER